MLGRSCNQKLHKNCRTCPSRVIVSSIYISGKSTLSWPVYPGFPVYSMYGVCFAVSIALNDRLWMAYTVRKGLYRDASEPLIHFNLSEWWDWCLWLWQPQSLWGWWWCRAECDFPSTHSSYLALPPSSKPRPKTWSMKKYLHHHFSRHPNVNTNT